MKRHALILWLFLMVTYIGYAQDDHLTPSSSASDSRLHPERYANRKKTKAHYVCNRSWGNPAIGFYLEKEGESDYLVTWEQEMKQEMKKKRIRIPSFLARDIEALFATACNQIDYPEYECFGSDISIYEFSTLDEKGRLLAGYCILTTPYPHKKQLVILCNQLCALADEPTDLQQLSRKMRALRQSMIRYAWKWRSHSKVYKTSPWATFIYHSYKKEWDENAQFPGMNPADYVLARYVYPEALWRKNIWVFMLATVNIDENGKVTGVRMNCLEVELEKEIKQGLTRIIEDMPAWIPAKKGGKAVKSTYSFAMSLNPLTYRERFGLE